MRRKNGDEYAEREAEFVWSTFLFAGAVLVAVVLYGVYLIFCDRAACTAFEWQLLRRTNSFEECVANGFPVTETAPRECRAGRRIFTEGLAPSILGD